jgi:hypothetical protein
MSSSRCALLAAALVAVPFTLIAEEPDKIRTNANAETQTNATVSQGSRAQARPAVPQPPPIRPTARSIQGAIVRSVVPPTPKAIPTPPPTGWGLVSAGSTGGGAFSNSDGTGLAYIGRGDIGIDAYGTLTAGYFGHLDATCSASLADRHTGIIAHGSDMGGSFQDQDSSGLALVGYGDLGIYAQGDSAGGSFIDSLGSGSALVAYGHHGIQAFGNLMGGYFGDNDSTGYLKAGFGNRGLEATGTEMGGHFSDSDGTGTANVGFGDRGIVAYGAEAGGHFEGGSHGVTAYGTTGGGEFVALGSTGVAHVATGDIGISASGSEAGGVFVSHGLGALAKVGVGNRGIDAMGTEMAGYFHVDGGSGYAHLAVGDRGIEAFGPDIAGYFEALAGTGTANVGYGDRGVHARGSEMGGYFEDSDGTGTANVGYGNLGVHASGSQMGGFFEDTDGTAYAYVGWGTTGVLGRGDDAGGVFEDENSSGYAKAGFGDRGVEAGGSDMGGYFEDTDGSGFAHLGWGNTGVFGRGSVAGGVFDDDDDSGYAWVGWGDRGLVAGGTEMGGRFEDTDSSIWANVATDTYKIDGNGTVNFVQNHPYDSESVIVYTAPEGDEVATYTRGTARLIGGEARVPLGETFQWVTNPDIGLTAHAMPVGEWSDLYVAEISTQELVIRSRDGVGDGTFHYLVYGLRIGFEESTVVQEKPREAYIPSMKSHRDRAVRSPELARHTALSRWTAVRKALGDEEPLDLSRAHALRDLIQEYDPAVHGPLGARRTAETTVFDPSQDTAVTEAGGAPEISPNDRPSSQRRAVGRIAEMPGYDPDRDVYARSFRPSAADLASLLEVSEVVEPGDVLAIDPERPGLMRRASTAEDPTVVGVVAASPGVVLGASGTGADAETAVAFAGVTSCKVDAGYGPVYPGDLLVTSPTPGHAMRADVPQPGTVLGKALEELADGTGTVKVLVMLR